MVETTDIKPVKDEMEKELKKDAMPIAEQAKDEGKEVETSDIKVIEDKKEMGKIEISATKPFTGEEKEKEMGDITGAQLTKEEELISKTDTSAVIMKEEHEQDICKDAISPTGPTTVQERDAALRKEDIKDDASTFKPTVEEEKKKEDDDGSTDATAATKLTMTEAGEKLTSREDNIVKTSTEEFIKYGRRNTEEKAVDKEEPKDDISGTKDEESKDGLKSPADEGKAEVKDVKVLKEEVKYVPKDDICEQDMKEKSSELAPKSRTLVLQPKVKDV
ncbi:hypothetical protein KUCAC02_020756 [Chaenocephalus aceratus]|uniref:Uncharacterized protein n=1 Tax=Chaenocephalus aceratus TaxID=36190 RepID=A0ACB9XEN5_CHAAC|nr:hypothetical protein KUCAC02_020756 [Chaenocephalus aceratus]